MRRGKEAEVCKPRPMAGLHSPGTELAAGASNWQPKEIGLAVLRFEINSCKCCQDGRGHNIKQAQFWLIGHEKPYEFPFVSLLYFIQEL